MPLIIATILREEGATGVQTHVQELRRYLDRTGEPAVLVTPFSAGYLLAAPVFGLRLALVHLSGAASVLWYRHWHEAFLRRALRRRLAKTGECVIYAQGPEAARAALRARRGPHQRVVMAVHFKTSHADEWATVAIKSNGAVYRAIRRAERATITRLDGLVYVSQWARDALLSWLPEAADVPDAVISNFITAPRPETEVRSRGDLVTVGGLSPVKNHRYLLEILAAARRAGRHLTLDVYGADGRCTKALLRQARALGLQQQVRWRGARQDVRELLPGYRAYVHASYSESSSFAIIEAMAAGLPIVTGKTGGIAEICDDSAEARYWPLDDATRAARVLIDLLDCEPDRQACAKAATARFHRDFSAEVLGPRLRDFLINGDRRMPAAQAEMLGRQ